MKTIERIKMVKAMEFIARNINDEDVFEDWLVGGVDDGDIEYGDLSVADDDIDNLEFYIRDQNFSDLMDSFLGLMRAAKKSGGLYCDEIVSGWKYAEED